MDSIGDVLPAVFAKLEGREAERRPRQLDAHGLPHELSLAEAWSLSEVQQARVCGHWVQAAALRPHLVEAVPSGFAEVDSTRAWPKYTCKDADDRVVWTLRGDLLSLV